MIKKGSSFETLTESSLCISNTYSAPGVTKDTFPALRRAKHYIETCAISTLLQKKHNC